MAKILLVDSNQGDRELLLKVLAGMSHVHHDLVIAHDLGEALKNVSCESFETILLDLNLSDSKGIKTFQTLSQKARNSPILIVTNLEDEKLALEAVKQGAQDYLVKSVLNPRMLGRVMTYAIERKNADQALRESQERNKILVESAYDAFVGMDERGKITQWNGPARNLFGWHLEEVLGKYLWEVFIPVGQKELYKNDFRDYLLIGESQFINRRHEILVVNKAGRQFPAEIAMWPLRSGETCSFGTFIHDITERKELDAMKDSFVSTVSHELRTPLTAIQESVAIVEDGSLGPLNEKQKYFLNNAKRNVERLARFINTVLDYQKLGTTSVKFDIHPYDINELILEVKRSYELVAGKKGLSIEARLENGLPPVACDKDKITQVLYNLVMNAIKFSEKGSIEIRSQKLGPMLQVAVADQGIGISEENLPKLFKSFSQVSQGFDRTPSGSGLGLVISDRIIREHHGKLRVESTLGKGSAFYFTLPIQNRRE